MVEVVEQTMWPEAERSRTVSAPSPEQSRPGHLHLTSPPASRAARRLPIDLRLLVVPTVSLASCYTARASHARNPLFDFVLLDGRVRLPVGRHLKSYVDFPLLHPRNPPLDNVSLLVPYSHVLDVCRVFPPATRRFAASLALALPDPHGTRIQQAPASSCQVESCAPALPASGGGQTPQCGPQDGAAEEHGDHLRRDGRQRRCVCLAGRTQSSGLEYKQDAGRGDQRSVRFGSRRLGFEQQVLDDQALDRHHELLHSCRPDTSLLQHACPLRLRHDTGPDGRHYADAGLQARSNVSSLRFFRLAHLVGILPARSLLRTRGQWCCHGCWHGRSMFASLGKSVANDGGACAAWTSHTCLLFVRCVLSQ